VDGKGDDNVNYPGLWLAMKEIVKRSSSLGIKHLTVYAFSTENWKRSTEEVNGIFKLSHVCR
jgi:undecaprenyl diphosphate synthase